jgi:hypothetical protein
MGSRNPPACDPNARPLKKGLEGKRVRVHLNLHNGCVVISHGGRVQGYTKGVTLRNVVPKISKAGYDRCRATKTKNVHAYLQGELVKRSAKRPGRGWRKITYNCRGKGGRPAFRSVRGGATYEGSTEARLIPKKGGGCEVWVKGKPAKENPPSCACRNPGGLCGCGRVEHEEPHGAQNPSPDQKIRAALRVAATDPTARHALADGLYPDRLWAVPICPDAESPFVWTGTVDEWPPAWLAPHEEGDYEAFGYHAPDMIHGTLFRGERVPFGGFGGPQDPNRNPPNPIAALHGSERTPVQVLGPTWPGYLKYWDVRFPDGDEGTVTARELFTEGNQVWRKNPPVQPCGSPVPESRLGVHLIQRKPRACVVLLDLANVRAYDGRDLEVHGACPLLAAWGQVGGNRIARTGLDGVLADELTWLGPWQRSDDLVALAQRSGVDLLDLEDQLCREGAAWWQAKGAAANPGDEELRRTQRRAAAGGHEEEQRHFLERLRRGQVPFSADGLEGYLGLFPAQTVEQIAAYWDRPVQSVAALLAALSREDRAHSDFDARWDEAWSPGRWPGVTERKNAIAFLKRQSLWRAGPDDFSVYYLPDLLSDARLDLPGGRRRRTRKNRIRGLTVARNRIRAAVMDLEDSGLSSEAEFSRAYLAEVEALLEHVKSGGRWAEPQREAVTTLKGNLRAEARRLYGVVPQ